MTQLYNIPAKTLPLLRFDEYLTVSSVFCLNVFYLTINVSATVTYCIRIRNTVTSSIGNLVTLRCRYCYGNNGCERNINIPVNFGLQRNVTL